jgi:hypothetical protein
MALATLMLRGSITWSLWTPWLLMGLGCALIGCWIAVFTMLISWGVESWGQQPQPPLMAPGKSTITVRVDLPRRR